MIDGKSTSHLASALRQAAGASVRADLRTSARAAAHVAMQRWEDVWSASSHVTNAPIDVIDMFSGCGGMSAGFRAANGLVPAFRLAAAVDIDTVANATYASNLNVVPLREDISRLARQTGPLEVLPSRRAGVANFDSNPQGHGAHLDPRQTYTSELRLSGIEDIKGVLRELIAELEGAKT